MQRVAGASRSSICSQSSRRPIAKTTNHLSFRMTGIGTVTAMPSWPKRWRTRLYFTRCLHTDPCALRAMLLNANPQGIAITVVGNDFDESLFKYKNEPPYHYFAELPDGRLELRRVDFRLPWLGVLCPNRP